MEPIMLTTIPPFQVVSHVIKKPPNFSLRGRRFKGKGKGVLCARETREAGEEGAGGRERRGKQRFPPFLPPRALLAPPTPFPFHFKPLPRRLASLDARNSRYGKEKMPLVLSQQDFLRLCIT